MDEQASSSTHEHRLPLSVVMLAGITQAANGVRDYAINSQRPDNCGTAGNNLSLSHSSSVLPSASSFFCLRSFLHGDAAGLLCDLCQYKNNYK